MNQKASSEVNHLLAFHEELIANRSSLNANVSSIRFIMNQKPISINQRSSAYLIFLILLLAACNLAPPTPAAPPTSLPVSPVPSPTLDRWYSLMLNTPYPWSTPLPPYTATTVDGTYAKLDPDEPQWWNCMRCSDWLPAGGVWRLQLDNGIYRVYYAVDSWRSLGSFSLAGDSGNNGRIYFFNDPNCPKVVGEYTWTLENGVLTFQEVNDECAIRMCAANLIKQPWLSCQPPNLEAAISDHWPKPPGCIE